MSRLKRWLAAGLAATAFACASQATVYTWDAGGANDEWTTCGNWDHELQIPCYPNSNSHDAILPSGSSWDVIIVTNTIDTFTIESSTDFVGKTFSPSVNSFIYVDGALTISGGTSTATTITMGAYGRIETK